MIHAHLKSEGEAFFRNHDHMNEEVKETSPYLNLLKPADRRLTLLGSFPSSKQQTLIYVSQVRTDSISKLER